MYHIQVTTPLPLRESVNQLTEQGYVTTEGKKANLHFHLGGDYKVS